jgi:hypothetical protein
MKPVASNPIIDGNNVTLEYNEKTLPRAAGSTIVCITTLNAPE